MGGFSIAGNLREEGKANEKMKIGTKWKKMVNEITMGKGKSGNKKRWDDFKWSEI